MTPSKVIPTSMHCYARYQASPQEFPIIYYTMLDDKCVFTKDLDDNLFWHPYNTPYQVTHMFGTTRCTHPLVRDHAGNWIVK